MVWEIHNISPLHAIPPVGIIFVAVSEREEAHHITALGVPFAFQNYEISVKRRRQYSHQNTLHDKFHIPREAFAMYPFPPRCYASTRPLPSHILASSQMKYMYIIFVSTLRNRKSPFRRLVEMSVKPANDITPGRVQ